MHRLAVAAPTQAILLIQAATKMASTFERRAKHTQNEEERQLYFKKAKQYQDIANKLKANLN